jgi:hypothetical protein
VSTFGKALAGDASGDAKSNAQSAANALRIHSDSIVTVRVGGWFAGFPQDAGCREEASELR